MNRYTLRSDSAWKGLTVEQGERLDEWLFTERLGHAEALERAGKEWGIAASLASMGRYYRFRRKARAFENLTGSAQTSKEVNRMPVKLLSLSESSLKLVGCRLQDCALDGGDLEELTALTKLVLEAEKRQIQRERLQLAREKFQFNAAEAALAELPHVGELTADEVAREKERVQGIIKRIFGKEAPIEM